MIPDVVVKFELADRVATGGYLSVTDGTRVDSTNRIPSLSLPPLAQTVYVRTIAGVARVTYQFGTIGQQRITVNTVGVKSKEIRAELASSSELSKKIVEDTNQRQSEDTRKYDLIAVITDDGEPQAGETVMYQDNQRRIDSCFFW